MRDALPMVYHAGVGRTIAPMRYRTVKAVRAELHRRGGYLETIRDTESPEYAPHLSQDERGWPHGLLIKDELLDWANETLA